MAGVVMLLLVTSLIGSLIGFLVCYGTIVQSHHVATSIRTRVCMVNSMALAFIFAMLIELTTGSKSLAIIVPLITVCLPIVLMVKPFSVLDAIESCMATLMSVSMSVMLIDMVNPTVIWLIQCILVLIEALLYLSILRKMRLR
jgi:hypothetical protein